MRRPLSLMLLGSLCMPPGVSAATPETIGSEQPNIVFILVDDLDFDEIGVYDHERFPSRTGAHARNMTEWREDWRYYADPRMHTPEIDSLAREGARFDRFYVTTAICSPSRYSFLTGRYGSRSRPFTEEHPPGTEALVNWSTKLGPTEANLPRALNRLGYRTGMVGKWHLGFPRELIDPVPGDADPADPEIARQIRANYARSVAYIEETTGFDDVSRLYLRNKEAGALGIPDSLRHHNTEWITEGALEFIERGSEAPEPFFLFVSLTIPHSQFEAIYGEFTGADPLATPAGLLEEPATGQPSRESIYERLKALGIDPRNAMATWMDDSVGAILGKLETRGVAENTLVVFTSDHQSRGKFTCYEGTRVPFLARWPRNIAPETRVASLSANIDLVPTLYEAAGGNADDLTGIDGESLLPLLSGERPSHWRTALLLESGYSRAVVTPRWKYLANRPPEAVVRKMDADRKAFTRTGELRDMNWTGRENPHDWGEVGIRYVADVDFPNFFDYDQLYDLENDPFEQVNLADYPHFQDILKALKREMSRQLEDMPHTFGEFHQ
ncbi:MAG: sulfatase-like hydrolase/transferase [Oceanipulchritudo sp.]